MLKSFGDQVGVHRTCLRIRLWNRREREESLLFVFLMGYGKVPRHLFFSHCSFSRDDSTSFQALSTTKVLVTPKGFQMLSCKCHLDNQQSTSNITYSNGIPDNFTQKPPPTAFHILIESAAQMLREQDSTSSLLVFRP